MEKQKNLPYYELIIDINTEGQRLDKLARKRYIRHYPSVPLSAIFRWLRKGHIRVNGKHQKYDYHFFRGDVVFFPIPHIQEGYCNKKQKYEKLSDDYKKYIIYRDYNRCIWNKPVGISTHTNQGQNQSMQKFLEKFLSDEGFTHPTFTPAFCYRLDRDTSGILISGLTCQAVSLLNEQIRERKTHKYYLTLLVGRVETGSGWKIINTPLKKVFDKNFQRGKMSTDKFGKISITYIQTIGTWMIDGLGDVSLVLIKLETGRMHQIRVHSAFIGHPLVGDVVYGIPSVNRKFFRSSGLHHHLLHCWKYGFVGHNENVCIFTAPFPQTYQQKIHIPDNVNEKVSLLSQKLDTEIHSMYD